MQPSNVIDFTDNQSNNLNPGDDDLATETLAELPTNSVEPINPEGLVCGILGDKLGNADMEVDYKGSMEGFKDLVERSERGSVSLESDSGAVMGETKAGDVGVVEVGDGVGESDVGVNGSSGQASFNSTVQQLFPKLVDSERIDEKVTSAGADGLAPDTEKAVGGDGAVEVIGSSAMAESEAVGSGTGVGVGKNENSGANVSESRLSGLKDEHENEAVGAETGALASHGEKIGGDVTEGDSLGDQENEEAGGSIKDSRDARGSVRGLSGSKRSREVKSKSRGGFCTSDLVWGKVRSHPWWPAQIFEPGDASDQAMKYFRQRSYLVAYFGDQTFAWNDEAKLKPFMPHFSQMAKQSNMEAFRHAVDCALDELTRRVEFGLSCHCIADDAYSQLKTQVFKNAGLGEKSSMHEGKDTQFSALSFEPAKFLGTVKNLAQTIHVEDVDRLDHVMTQAQMSAFYRWKGYYHLAEFGQLIGYVNNEADAPIRSEKEEIHEMVSVATVAPKENEEEDNTRPKKRKNLSSGSHSTKKVKSLSGSMGKKRKRFGSERDDGDETEGKRVRNSILPSPGRRNSESKTVENSPQSVSSRDKSSFRVGESILRAAGQLSRLSPLLKCNLSSEGKTTKGKGKSKQSQEQTEAIPFEDTSSDVIISQLRLTAVESWKEHNFLSSMISFVSDFRNSVAQDFELVLKHEDSGGDDIVGNSEDNTSESGPEEIVEACSSGGKSEEKVAISGITTTSGFDGVEDDCCPDKFIKVPERQISSSDVKMAPVDPQFAQVDGISAALTKVGGTTSGCQLDSVSENATSEGGQLGEDTLLEESPTALTLKFTDMDSIPTEAKLHKIFSAFGPLKESETEVLAKKNCARVVFKMRSDAEAAFSSSGKFETFGASLICYRLNYAPSPLKSSSPEAKQKRKGVTPLEGIAA